MHPLHLRRTAADLHRAGVPFGDVCARLGLPRSTVANWLYGERGRSSQVRPAEVSRCPRCRAAPGLPDDQAGYAYLLGLYLGDGHLVTSVRVPVLRIYCADAWPGLIDLCAEAMRAVLARKVHRVAKRGCAAVQSYSTHWPCLLPQHGPGRKHDRRIALEPWQRAVVGAHHGSFLRGLIHSDGCRVINRVRRGDKVYEYPRYHFSNESADIMGLCQGSLDALGVRWRMCRRNLLSVARRGSVAELDPHVGAKW